MAESISITHHTHEPHRLLEVANKLLAAIRFDSAEEVAKVLEEALNQEDMMPDSDCELL